MDQQNIYWLFSSAAQSISAFIALLLAGFALVHAMMDAAQQGDESLTEIHEELKRHYYIRIRAIAALTAIAIVGSLAMVYINGLQVTWKMTAAAVVASADVVAIVVGVLFIITVIDPQRYRKAVASIIEKDEGTLGLSGTSVQQSAFFAKFVALERRMRDYIATHEVFVPGNAPTQPMVGFRHMLDVLMLSQVIDKDLYNDLMKINRYRNLVFHGKSDEIDLGMLDQLDSASERLFRALD